MTWEKEAKEINEKRNFADQMGGKEAVELQYKKGRLPVRERINRILDNKSFNEIGKSAGFSEYNDNGSLKKFTPGNFILGFGKINKRPVVIGGEDFSLKGGSPNAAGLRKSIYTEELALKYKVPLIRLHEGAGGSVGGTNQEKSNRPTSDAVYTPSRFISLANTLGEVPVATAALGPVAGLPASRLVASHFSVMTESSLVLIAGPKVVKRALNIDVTKEALGGPEVHLKSGVINNLAKTEDDAFEQIKTFLSFVPDNAWSFPDSISTNDKEDRCDDLLIDIIPKDRRRPYSVRKIITSLLDINDDQSTFFEIGKKYGPSLVTGLGRLNGQSVGVIANDCMFYAGAMTTSASKKLERFSDFCNSFHIPIISLVDEPGFMIGPESEKSGTIRFGTAAISAIMQSRVPWASVHMHKSFGVAATAHYGPDSFTLLWPSALSGALPVEGGVAVAFSKEIARAKNPEKKQKELEDQLAQRQSPIPRAEGFSAHDLIDPRETRPRLISWLELALKAYRLKSPKPYLVTMRP